MNEKLNTETEAELTTKIDELMVSVSAEIDYYLLMSLSGHNIGDLYNEFLVQRLADQWESINELVETLGGEKILTGELFLSYHQVKRSLFLLLSLIDSEYPDSELVIDDGYTEASLILDPDFDINEYDINEYDIDTSNDTSVEVDILIT